jgi:HSP20 family protein
MAFYRTRWGEPRSAVDQLRREIDALLGSWSRDPSRLAQSRAPNVFPPVNLYEDGDALVLMAEVPGVRGDDLDVSVEGGRVVLRGRRSIEHPADASAHRRERQEGAFHRTVELPYAVDGERAGASYRNGVLMIRLPKPGERQRRQIQVRTT